MPAPRTVSRLTIVLALAALPAGNADAGDLRFGLRLGERSGAFLAVGDPPASHHNKPHPKPAPPGALPPRLAPRLAPGFPTKPRAGGTVPRTGIAPPPGAAELRRRFDFRPKRAEPPPAHHPPHHRDRFGIVFVPRPEPAPAAPAAAPPPRATPRRAEPAEPPPPPDPRGPLLVPARGVGSGPAYTVGAPLPPDLPHVTLDWRRYDLPEPPPGLIYARVGRDVLLIDPVTRRVERRLDPAEPTPAG